MKKRQWRMLITEILEARNQATTDHAFIENRLSDIDARLAAIERRLPAEPDTIMVTAESEPPPTAIDYANLRWRTQNEDGTWRDCID